MARWLRSLIVLFGACVLIAAGVVGDRIALYPVEAQQVGTCFIYMLTNPDLHKSACGPQPAGDVTQSAASG